MRVKPAMTIKKASVQLSTAQNLQSLTKMEAYAIIIEAKILLEAVDTVGVRTLYRTEEKNCHMLFFQILA